MDAAFVGFDNILSCKTTAVLNDVKKLYLQLQNKEQFINIDIKMFQIELAVKDSDAKGTRLEMPINEWNVQEFYNLYYNIEEQWFIYKALNHEKVLPAAGTTILASCGGCSVFFT